MITEWKTGGFTVKKAETRAEMGRVAAADAEAVIARLIKERGEINMIFAAAPSQNEMLENLLSSDKIDWRRVNAFHMDEYVGLPEGDPHTFGVYLKEHIFDKAPFKSVHYVRGFAEDPDKFNNVREVFVVGAVLGHQIGNYNVLATYFCVSGENTDGINQHIDVGNVC